VAKADARFQKDLAKYARGLESFLDADKVHKHAIVRHAKGVVNAVIGTAKAGIGPDNQPYKEYSESYKKQLGSRAGKKLWLVGGEKPVMLDRKRFNWEIRRKTGQLFLIWKGPVYGPVHQGTEYGGADHTKGKIPPRPWMHFDTDAARAAVNKMYRSTMEERTAQFNAGRLR